MFFYCLIFIVLGTWALISSDTKEIEVRATPLNRMDCIEDIKSKVTLGYILFSVSVAAFALLLLDFILWVQPDDYYGSSPIFHSDWGFGSSFSLAVGGVIMLIWLGALISNRPSYSGAEEKIDSAIKKKADREKAKEEEANQKKQLYDTGYKEVSSVFGTPDKIIFVPGEENNFDKAVVAINSTKTLLIQGRSVNYKDILGFSWNDDAKSITETKTVSDSTSTTNTGSMIGRSLVGAAVAGGTGAIIGGATAKREGQSTATSTSQTTIKHHYVVVINVSDIANPVIRVDCKESGNTTNEIMGLLTAITNGAIPQPAFATAEAKEKVDPVIEHVRELKALGYILPAIKYYKDNKGVDLEEAKRIIESL